MVAAPPCRTLRPDHLHRIGILQADILPQGADVVAVGLIHAARAVGARRRRMNIQVADRHGERSARIGRCQRPGAIGRVVAELPAEAVHAMHAQAAELRTHVLDGVIDADGLIQIVQIAEMRSIARREIVARREHADRIRQRVVLPPQRQRAIALIGKADIGLPAEHQAALAGLAILEIEAAFQHEQTGQAIAQTFPAPQPQRLQPCGPQPSVRTELPPAPLLMYVIPEFTIP